MGRISFSANQWVISLICICCSDSLNEIILLSPALHLSIIPHHVLLTNHVHDHKAKLVPVHHASTFPLGILEQIHDHLEAVPLHLLQNELPYVHGVTRLKLNQMQP